MRGMVSLQYIAAVNDYTCHDVLNTLVLYGTLTPHRQSAKIKNNINGTAAVVRNPGDSNNNRFSNLIII